MRCTKSRKDAQRNASSALLTRCTNRHSSALKMETSEHEFMKCSKINSLAQGIGTSESVRTSFSRVKVYYHVALPR